MSKHRLSNFSGSVTRRGRSYWIRYSGPRDPLTGKRRRICETIKVATEQEARNEITKRQAAILTGEFVQPTPLTLGAYLEEWFVNYSASPKTRERVRGYLDKQILPFLGSLRLQALDKERIRAWHAALADRGHYRGGPLAPQTIRNCHRALRRALRDAIPQFLPRNPVADASTPAVPLTQKQVLARADARLVLDRLAGHAYLQGVAALALGGGLRIGEVIALTLGDAGGRTLSKIAKDRRGLSEGRDRSSIPHLSARPSRPGRGTAPSDRRHAALGLVRFAVHPSRRHDVRFLESIARLRQRQTRP